ncbi:MAG: hypothetical protein ACI9JM_001631 [Halioglobus sp.]|jgi:hypothetical protein
MQAISTHQLPPVDTAANSVDLMPYINALIAAKWWVLAAAIAGCILAGVMAFRTPYMFQSGAKVSIVNTEDPGGVSPDDRRVSEVLTLVEHGFVMGTTRDNYNQVMLARLMSRDFTMHFLEVHNVFRYFYPEEWNAEKGSWAKGFSPDLGDSYIRFRDEVISMENDEETDIITVKVRWTDPVIARDLANLYVEAFNDWIREKTMTEVQRKQKFLQAELMRSDIMDIQQSIYRLIEAQTAISMLVSARPEYALEIIDPAATAWASYNMSRKKKIIMGVFAGTMLSIFAIFLIVIVKGMLGTLQAARAGSMSTIRTDTNNKNTEAGEN